jgi:hypothetical protein
MPTNTNAITQERLDAWQELLDIQHATPIMLLAVGHDSRAGEVHVCVPDDLTSAAVRSLLVAALQELA